MKMGNKEEESVKVIVRCRPLNDKELANANAPVVEVEKRWRKVRIRPSGNKDVAGEKEFTFDAVYGMESTQQEIYQESVQGLVEAVLQGFNGTIFAYGQTGTGKTFTMQGSKTNPGIIPRAMEAIFKHIDQSANEHYLVNASYLEIYQEEIRDLLRTKDKDDHDKKIEIKEKSSGDIYIKNLSQYQLKSLRHMEKMMERGQSNRAVGATDMNEQSSRSHAIFIVNIECGQLGLDGREHIRVGKLNLVDLAGSEKQSKTNSTGDRFKEATQINLSLSTLGKVITSLVEKASHVPYRDSKLTRLLQDSLGGNSKTIMLANIGPVDYNLEETLSTLRYANRAKSIKNTPHINEDPKDAKIREYLDELTALKAKLSTKPPKDRPANKKTDKPADEDDSDSETFAHEHANIARQRALIADNNDLDQQEKENLLREFNVKEANLRKREEERQQLKAKVDAIEQRMLHGSLTVNGNVQERMLIQTANLSKRRLEIDEQRKREEAILRALDQEHQVAQQANVTVSVVQVDIDVVQSKINKLQMQVQALQKDIAAEEDVAQQFNADVGDQVEHLRQKESLLWTMVSHFISPALWQPLVQKARYDEKLHDWTLPREETEMVGPPLFVDVPTYRWPDIRDQYTALLSDNIIEVALDYDEEMDNVQPHAELNGVETVVADLLAETLDAASLEEDIVIDADVFTIERPPTSRPATVPLDFEKDKYVRRTSVSKTFRGSPDLTFPTSRGWIK